LPTILINTDYDGFVEYDEVEGTYTKFDTEIYAYVGYAYYTVDKLFCPLRDRGYFRFPLTALPENAIVTRVRFKVGCISAGATTHLTDIHAYGTNGQEDPQADPPATVYERCATGNLYVNDSDARRTINTKWWTLGEGADAQACIDVKNAKLAVNRFSIALHEEGDNDTRAGLATIEREEVIPQLEITYTIPPVWGGSALPHVQMAKVILGLTNFFHLRRLIPSSLR